MAAAGGANDADSSAIARLVAADAGLSLSAAMSRVTDVQIQMRQEADAARQAASIVSLWTAFALLFGAIVAVGAAISSRWMDDRISFSLAPRR
jgi:capsular polysaccharide biosynthesis protein